LSRSSLTTDGLVRRFVVMTAVPEARVDADNPYDDRVEGDV
jgi:hypothetical protein